MIDESLLQDLREGKKEAFELLVHKAVEEALRALPGVMKSLMIQASYVQQLNTTFYDKHKDLKGQEDLVLKTLERIEGENPGTPYESVLEKTAAEVRKVTSEFGRLSMQETSKPSLEHLDHLAGMFEGDDKT